MTTLPAQAAFQIEAAVSAVQRRLGDTLRGAYLYGSSMAGGLRPHSDVDLLAAVSERVAEAARGALTADLLNISGAPGSAIRPLELTLVVLTDVVPWRYPPMCELQFGEWLRADLESGAIPHARPDPDLAILLTSAREHGKPLLGPHPAALFEPVPERDVARAMIDTLPGVAAAWRGDERNALLTLCRMWATAVTSELLPKDAAASWALERLPLAHRRVLERARAEYVLAEKQDWAALHDEVSAAVAHLRHCIERALANRRWASG